ncbi:6-pyruvoyltetrahydropterin/6-carboxytetrahydropterin synthase [Saccharopolyspora lacisalsi]|uniref:6-carboxy-5,6,7,8-tetrahydropterin synthase n=1 Tax=Halosaccharopolyspora lacisalsi TaxID=1000566 RepID=A0A839DQK6_9PSEU|nr:6-carboxytetrahydropterin synthase [Halosaccharopolyspora lacisalsi]MBA8823794.1 6-pyruvoyltetrahydropterin/6-carboxytetrahydropterin synthase [Halosaccharopolyspora lacisalsi]
MPENALTKARAPIEPVSTLATAIAGRYTISKTFTFAAAHHLPGLPDGHKCGRNHGHTWRVRVAINAEELTGPGWVTDFGDLAPLARFIEQHLDHQDLNAVLPVSPTSENLAAFVAAWCQQHLEPTVHGRLESVTVSEGDDLSVEFRPRAVRG